MTPGFKYLREMLYIFSPPLIIPKFSGTWGAELCICSNFCGEFCTRVFYVACTRLSLVLIFCLSSTSFLLFHGTFSNEDQAHWRCLTMLNHFPFVFFQFSIFQAPWFVFKNVWLVEASVLSSFVYVITHEDLHRFLMLLLLSTYCLLLVYESHFMCAQYPIAKTTFPQRLPVKKRTDACSVLILLMSMN